MALSFDPRRKRVRLIALTCGLCAAPLPAAAAPYRVEAISPVTAIVYEVDNRAKYRVIIGSTVEQLSALQIAGDTDTVTVRDVRSGKVQKITRATVPADSRSPWQRAWAQLVDVFAIQQRSGSSQGPATGAVCPCACPSTPAKLLSPSNSRRREAVFSGPMRSRMAFGRPTCRILRPETISSRSAARAVPN